MSIPQVGRRLSAFAALWVAACQEADQPPASPSNEGPALAQRADTLIGGQNSDASQDSTVLIRVDTGNGEVNVGTGVLIAPNLLMAALHTVSVVKSANDTFPCVPGKVVLDVYALRDVSTIGVFPGMIRPGPNAKPPVATKKIFPMPVSDLCQGDLSVVQLESDLPDAMISPIRFEDTVKVGDTFYGVGWGIMTTAKKFPIQRQTLSGLQVLALGPGPYLSPTGLTTYELYDAHMVVSPGVCFGDSGGGLFDPITNALVGNVSAGQNDDPNKVPTPTEPSKYCDGATIFYTRLSPFKDTILAAFKEAGHAPWIEGRPKPAAFGTPCTAADECDSLACVRGLCSRSCATDSCPDTFECISQGDEKVCALPEMGAGGNGGEGGGGSGGGGGGEGGGANAVQGTACEQPSDCASGLCAQFTSQKLCTEACDSRPCEGGWQCGSLGSAKVCLPPSSPAEESCRQSAPGAAGAGRWALTLAGLGLGLALARRQRRRV